jgi:uncharacterized protein YndB with AHSA1/START domain
MKVEPVRKQIDVEASAEKAFRVFTARFDAWWPREHHIGKADLKAAIIEPRTGGRWYEVGVDGTECDWGRVLVWDPPHRLVMAWQLNAAWNYDPGFETELELRFTAITPHRTRVALEHRDMERFGDAAAATREALDGAGGWITHLTRFAATAAEEAPATNA